MSTTCHGLSPSQRPLPTPRRRRRRRRRQPQHARPTHIFILTLFVVIISLLSSTSEAIVYTRPRNLTFPAVRGEIDFTAQYSPTLHVIDVYPGGFGFEYGGTLSVNISAVASDAAASENTAQKMRDASMLLMVMPWEAWRLLDLAQYDRNLGQTYYLCEVPTYARFPLVLDRESEVVIDRLPMLYTDKYSILLVKCEDRGNMPAISFQVQGIEMVNPRANHLSLEQVPRMNLNLFIAGFYAMVACAIVIMAMCCGHVSLLSRSYAIRLYVLLLLTVLARVGMSIVHYLYFWWLRQSGERHMYLAAIRDSTIVVSETLLYSVLLLIGMGYCITRTTVQRAERVALLLLVAAYAFSQLFESTACQNASEFMEGTAGLADWWPSTELFPRFCATFSVIRTTLQCLIIFCIIITTNSSVDVLRALALGQRRPQQQREIFVTLKLFKSFRMVFIIVIIVPIAITFLHLLLLTWKTDWIFVLLRETLSAYMLCLTCYLFVPSHEPSVIGNLNTAHNTLSQRSNRISRRRGRIFSAVERIRDGNGIRPRRNAQSTQLLDHNSDDEERERIYWRNTAELVDTRTDRDSPVLVFH